MSLPARPMSIDDGMTQVMKRCTNGSCARRPRLRVHPGALSALLRALPAGSLDPNQIFQSYQCKCGTVNLFTFRDLSMSA